METRRGGGGPAGWGEHDSTRLGDVQGRSQLGLSEVREESPTTHASRPGEGPNPDGEDPKRPTLERDTIRALLETAATVHPFLRPLIVLAWQTGRRLGAILSLRWDDVHFEKAIIRWRAEHDKVRQTWVVPAHPEVLSELRRFRAVRAGDRFGHGIPSPTA